MAQRPVWHAGQDWCMRYTKDTCNINHIINLKRIFSRLLNQLMIMSHIRAWQEGSVSAVANFWMQLQQLVGTAEYCMYRRAVLTHKRCVASVSVALHAGRQAQGSSWLHAQSGWREQCCTISGQQASITINRMQHDMCNED